MNLTKILSEIEVNTPGIWPQNTDGEWWDDIEEYKGTDKIYVVNKIKNDEWLLEDDPTDSSIDYTNRPWAKQFNPDELEEAFKHASRSKPGVYEIELPNGDVLYPTNGTWKVEFTSG